MMRKRSLPILARACLAALVTVLFLSCSGDSSAPPTPPAPPPFQPQTVVVQLGTKGGATTLVSTQAGGWTRNGQPFTSGSTITGENSASYRLTLTNGTWSAAFIAPDPEPLVLGTSGDAVLLQAQEDGSYEVDGEPLASGRVVMADNGNQYRLVLGTDGTWMAEFAPPAPQLVHLGTSGESRQVSRTEDGGSTVNGEALAPGSLIRTSNGNQYTLTLGADGMTWTAVFVEGDPQRLLLGTSGDAPLLIYRQENGTFQLNGEPLLGGRVVEAGNGNRYRLVLGPDRNWQANYIPTPVTVRLGNTGGTVSLTPNEDGTWLRGSTGFSSGDKVTGSNGFEYILWLGSDGWFVEPLPMEVQVEVTGSDAPPIVLLRREDGTFTDGNDNPVVSGQELQVGGSTYTLRFADNRWTAQFLQGEIFVALGSADDTLRLIRKADGTYEHNGRRVRSGSIERSPNTGIRYRLRLANGVWSASVYVPPTVDPGVDPGVGTPPVVAENILDALPDELIDDNGAFSASDTATDANYRIQSGVSGTNADGDEVDYTRFSGSGRFEDDTFVESALRAINSILGPIEAQGLADGTDSQRFVAGVLINANWADVKTELDAIFGDDQISFSANPPQRGGETDVDEAIDELEDVRDDLSDSAKFKSAFQNRISTVTGATGDEIFNARKRVLALGSSANTRFGVISTLSASPPPTAAQVASGGQGVTQTAFAFSPLSATPTTDLPSRGTARYSGRTWAIDSEQVLYSGAIELLASIGIQQVKATVSDLRRSDTNASWVHENKDVREIKLPQINQADFTGPGFFNATSVTDAEVIFEQSGGLFPATVSGSDLIGQFVGTETGQNAGRAVIGTWEVGTVLDGAFGAERIRTNPTTLPSLTSTNRYLVVSTPILQGTTTIDSTTDSTAPTLSLGTTGYTDTFPLSSLGSVTNRAQSDASNLRATIRLRNTSFARFGVWKVVNSTPAPPETTDGLFAYSPLADTNFTTNSDYYPLRVDAEYAGRTVAIDGAGKLYDGSYLLTVDWNPAGSGQNSTLTAVISGLSGYTIGGVGVSQIGFSQTFTGGDFSGALDTTRVRYTTSSDVSLAGTHSHQGRFVGNNGPDGPYGVFGIWSIDTDGTADDIKGAFGADLVRAP